MPSTTNVNMMTTVHAKSNGIGFAVPDFCKTPTPAGPVPIPYPNTALSKDATDVSSTVTVDGNGIMVKGSSFAMSVGDEAGTAGGVASNKFKGKAEFMNYSFDVKVEGKAVARLKDPMGQNCGSALNVPSPAEGQQPIILLDISQIGATKDDACKKLQENEVPREGVDNPADKAGMLQKDFDAIKETCKNEKAIISFRDTNPACKKWLEQGVPSKGHDVLEKTWKADNLQTKELKDEFAGLVSDQMEMPEGKKFDNPRLHPKGKLTGDYDMMDMLDAGGGRIQGESPRDFRLRERMNRAIGEPDRIMHGCQSEYANYLKGHPDEKPVKSLFKPEKPLTVFDGSKGKVYRCETYEDVFNFYKCKDAHIPPEWEVYAGKGEVGKDKIGVFASSKKYWSGGVIIHD
ncbi:hypothetical protein OR1_01679 [Geobacter sp. OR-1]|uniref:DUF4150 domain-containing protein n=1 Tax=Geobacter sp. OR-1 TaxID=1266765 RepID=UPI000541D10A|nr:DUF4150 domain-containing protein [Geobacter sp. OR-1]GAM09401.1 hypothetical protein OR1_01679 [Geobacter sp. OR-1]